MRSYLFEQSHVIRILSEQFVEAAVTVGLVAGLLERALVQLLQAERAHKVLRMEFTEHGGDAAAGYRFGTAGAQRAAFGVIMRLAVRQTFEVEERSMLKRLTAVLRIGERYGSGLIHFIFSQEERALNARRRREMRHFKMRAAK